MKPDLKHGPFPVFNDAEDMRQWMDELNETKLMELLETQTEYVITNHRFDQGPEERIINYIENQDSTMALEDL